MDVVLDEGSALGAIGLDVGLDVGLDGKPIRLDVGLDVGLGRRAWTSGWASAQRS